MEKWLRKQMQAFVCFFCHIMKEKEQLFYLSSLISAQYTGFFGKCRTVFILNVLWSSCRLVWGTYRSFRDPQHCKTMIIGPWIMSLLGAANTGILGCLVKCMPAVLCKMNNPLKQGNHNWVVFLKHTMQWSPLRFLLPILAWWCHWKLLISKKLKVKEKILKQQIPFPLVGV